MTTKHNLFSIVSLATLLIVLLGGTPIVNAQTVESPIVCETLTAEDDSGCWIRMQNHENCYIWLPEEIEEMDFAKLFSSKSWFSPEEMITVDISDMRFAVAFEWGGQCRGGKAHGHGRFVMRFGVDMEMSLEKEFEEEFELESGRIPR